VLKVAEVVAYFVEQGWDFNAEFIRERLVIISEEQLREFYRFRCPGHIIPMKVQEWSSGKAKGEEKVPDFASWTDSGVLYVLDEVHIAFNSRAWQETGPAVIYYLSQHRKLGDDVVLISQSIQNVDKQMRSMAQDFTYVRNLTKEQHSLFRLPAFFIKRVFLELPTGPNVKAVQTGTFRLDVTGTARCYDTAAGVGIVGRSGADTGNKPKGYHWGWFVGGLVCFILAVVHFAPDFVEWVVNPGHHTSKVIAKAREMEPGGVGAGSNRVDVGVKELSSTNRVTGLAFLRGSYRLCFADGSVVEAKPSEVAYSRVHNRMVVNGVSYEVAPGL
jgi:hypothetical protein